eukprot:jgi/Tetstr1/464913/TSEL_009647.t1
MRGTLRQNDAYCSKEDVYNHVGLKPYPGARRDIEAVKDEILAGNITSDEVCLANPEFHHKYGRTLDRIEAIALRKRFRTEMTKGIWYTGPTASGKSHKVFDGFDPDTHYVKNLNEEWWDGYKGHPVVIFNEFRGQIKFSELLDLVDKWPKTVKWRNREAVPFLAKEIRIASIKPPEHVFARIVENEEEPWGQFQRRFTVINLRKRKSNVVDLLA